MYVCLCILGYTWYCLSFFIPTVALLSPLYLLLLLYGPLMSWLAMFTMFSFFPIPLNSVSSLKRREI